MFIVIEGPDGVGKSTVVNYITNNCSAAQAYSPFDTEYGSLVKKLLSQKCSQDMMLSTKIELMSRVIISAYEEIVSAKRNNEIIIMDRWIPSFFVYQKVLLNNDARHIFDQYFDYHNGTFVKPDFTIYLTAPINELEKRLGTRERFDILDAYAVRNMKSILSGYQHFIDNYENQDKYIVYENTNDLNTLLEEITSLVNSLIFI